MLQALIRGAMAADPAQDAASLTAALLGSLAYLPLDVGLAGLAEALGWPGWPGPELAEEQVRWSFWPTARLEAGDGSRIPVCPALLIEAPDRVLVVEASWTEEGAVLGPRLSLSEALAHHLASAADRPTRAAGAGLLGAQPRCPLPPPCRWASWATLHAGVAHRASAAELPPGLRRLVDDLGELLLSRGIGGPAGLAGLAPADPPLVSSGLLQRWRIEECWTGWAPLPPGPGSVLLPWDPTTGRGPGASPEGPDGAATNADRSARASERSRGR